MEGLDHLYQRIVSLRALIYPSFAGMDRYTKRETIKRLLLDEERLLEELSDLEEEYASKMAIMQKKLLRS